MGVDLNEEMVKRVLAQGYDAVKMNALSYLTNQKSSTASVISGFHIVEHIPFETLLDLFSECYRVIDKNGFVLFETPNPYNLVVGASTFYIDPSHIKPIPPDLLSFALEAQGFMVKTLYLHPVTKEIKNINQELKKVMSYIEGPRDYAVLAYKNKLLFD